jgi:hypothetical protein
MIDHTEPFRWAVKEKVGIAQKHKRHPVFFREDIDTLADLAYFCPEKLYELDLSADEIDALMAGMNIAIAD